MPHLERETKKIDEEKVATQRTKKKRKERKIKENKKSLDTSPKIKHV